MGQLADIFVTLGALFLLGFISDLLSRRLPLPRVSLLILFGFLIGPSGLGLLPDLGNNWFPFISTIALVMVGFLLGEKLTRAKLRKTGRDVMSISLTVVLLTAVIVFAGLKLFSFDTITALLLAAAATATDPAATTDVVHQLKARGRFTDTLLGIVAIDDAWGLILFSLLLAIAQTLHLHTGAIDILLTGGWELLGAVLCGVLMGVPMAYITGRVRYGEPTLIEALGVVFMCAGLALWMNVSFLLAAVVMGATVANLARHHERPFHAISGIEQPFLILFFMLAGASLELEHLAGISLLGACYVLLRVIGRLAGAGLGASLSGAEGPTRRWTGLAMMPQAGVALGMVLVAIQRLPSLSDTLLPVVVAATVVFELSGPVCTRIALIRAGEVNVKT
jgi:Kef-type K+ transport system membrane component KefB